MGSGLSLPQGGNDTGNGRCGDVALTHEETLEHNQQREQKAHAHSPSAPTPAMAAMSFQTESRTSTSTSTASFRSANEKSPSSHMRTGADTWWARLDSNQRPPPCQGMPRHRCTTTKSRLTANRSQLGALLGAVLWAAAGPVERCPSICAGSNNQHSVRQGETSPQSSKDSGARLRQRVRWPVAARAQAGR